MRTVVVSDIHGQPQLLSNALEHSNFKMGEDHLVFAGDFLDIGDFPIDCLIILERYNAEMLWGNHEHAILIGMHITPQNAISWHFHDFLWDRFCSRDWAVATHVGDVIITHAGVSQVYHETDIPTLVEQLNNEFYELTNRDVQARAYGELGPLGRYQSADDNGPLWFRPGLLMPAPGISQVFGHTPPDYLDQFDQCAIIDPYARGEDLTRWGEGGRYRYAVIEDSRVTTFDSRYT